MKIRKPKAEGRKKAESRTPKSKFPGSPSKWQNDYARMIWFQSFWHYHSAQPALSDFGFRPFFGLLISPFGF